MFKSYAVRIFLYCSLVYSPFAIACASDVCMGDEDIFGTNYDGSYCANAFPFFSPANSSAVNFRLMIEDIRGVDLKERSDQIDAEKERAVEFYARMASDLGIPASGYWIWRQHYPEIVRLFVNMRVMAYLSWLDESTIENVFKTIARNPFFHKFPPALDFARGVIASDIEASKRKALLRLRFEMLALDYDKMRKLKIGVDAGDVFERYLDASRLFYLGAYDQAHGEYLKLAESGQPWVSEAASYMLIRTQDELNGIQRSMRLSHSRQQDDFAYGELLKLRINDYLRRFPNGHYRHSAEAMLRRVYWLQGDVATQGVTYLALIESAPIDRLTEVINEMDIYYLPRLDIDSMAISDDFNLVHHLRSFRSSDYIDAAKLTIPVHDENNSSAKILRLAQKLFVERSYKEVLARIPDANGAPVTNMDFTLRVYRGLALNGSKDWGEAEQHWRQLIEDSLSADRSRVAQLGLANVWESSRQLQKLVDFPALISDRLIRTALIYKAADAEVLEHVWLHGSNQAERLLARDLLLEGYLKKHRYDDYLRIAVQSDGHELLTSDSEAANHRVMIWDGVSEEYFDYPCPNDRDLVKLLTEGEHSGRSLNCQGLLLSYWENRRIVQLDDYLRSTHFDNQSSSLNDGGDLNDYFMSTHLGNQSSSFIDGGDLEIDYYISVIELENVVANDRAFALHHAINCYLRGAPRCGSRMVAQEERARWFRLLKRKYGKTPWARAQQYYW